MLISFSTNSVCCHCSKTFHKTDKRQKACRPCAELSRLQKLPHQIEAKRAYHRDYGRQLRRKRGDRKFKGEVIRCARCGIDVVTKGIGQKYCEPCYPDAAKERDRRHDRQRHIRNGRVVVGSVINCRTCLKEFEKVGIHQIYCSPKCRQKRWSSDPQWTINRRMSAGVKSSLGDGKNGRSWETLVGYTVADLMAHLERQFLPGMSWDNRGEWHIDHIRPLCSFEFTSPDDPQFREAWALTNLRPLWARDNLRKGGRLDLLL